MQWGLKAGFRPTRKSRSIKRLSVPVEKVKQLQALSQLGERQGVGSIMEQGTALGGKKIQVFFGECVSLVARRLLTIRRGS